MTYFATSAARVPMTFGQSLFMAKFLLDTVRIPPGGKTDALVEATITWNTGGGRPLTTTGVDSDQLAAAIIATEKMLNSIIK